MERRKTIVWRCVIALTVLFIWGQSMLGRDLSRLQSESVQGILTELFGEEACSSFFFIHIRKVAHFCEFALLGGEWMGYRLSASGANQPPWWLVFVFGPVVAACDELIQIASARGPMVTDALLDCGGYAFGALLVFSIAWGYKQCRQKNAEK